MQKSTDSSICKIPSYIKTIDDMAESLLCRMCTFSKNFDIQTKILETVFSKMLKYKRDIYIFNMALETTDMQTDNETHKEEKCVNIQSVNSDSTSKQSEKESYIASMVIHTLLSNDVSISECYRILQQTAERVCSVELPPF